MTTPTRVQQIERATGRMWDQRLEFLAGQARPEANQAAKDLWTAVLERFLAVQSSHDDVR